MESRLNTILVGMNNIVFNAVSNKVILSEEFTDNWGINCHKPSLAEYSGTEFADMMFNLINKANANFNKLQDASVRVQIMDMVEEYYSNQNLMLERVTTAVEQMYKRPRKREEFIQKTMAAQKKIFFDNLPVNYEKKDVKYFTIDTSFGASEKKENVTIHKDSDIVRDRLFSIWEQIRKNDILGTVTGVRFVYTPIDQYGLEVSFPTIEFIMTQEGEKEVKKNQIKIEL